MTRPLATFVLRLLLWSSAAGALAVADLDDEER